MLQWLLCAVGVLAVSGCSLESSADTAMKAGLAGSWYYEFKDPSERAIKGVASLNQDGTFTERVRVEGESAEEAAKGLWHVTDGMLKLNSTERDGKKMGTLNDRYRTCVLGNLAAASFECSYAGGGFKLHFRKVQHGYELS